MMPATAPRRTTSEEAHSQRALEALVAKALGRHEAPRADPAGGPSAPFLLMGPRQSGKTSLLFHLAASRAGAGDGRVLVLCRRDKLYRAPPLALARGGRREPHDADALARVDVKYVESRAELLGFLACLHEHAGAARVHTVLLDDLDVLSRREASGGSEPSLSASDERAMQASAQAQVMAVMQDARKALERKRGAHVVVAATLTASAYGAASAARRARLWFPTAVVIEPDAERAGAYRMLETSRSGGAAAEPVAGAAFTIRQDEGVLDML